MICNLYVFVWRLLAWVWPANSVLLVKCFSSYNGWSLYWRMRKRHIHVTTKKEKENKKPTQNKAKQQGNVYKMWLFLRVEFMFKSTFMEKWWSSHKREVLDECTMNSHLSTSSLSRLWINCAAEALTLCWHCAGGSICTPVFKHSVPGLSPKL